MARLQTLKWQHCNMVDDAEHLICLCCFKQPDLAEILVKIIQSQDSNDMEKSDDIS